MLRRAATSLYKLRDIYVHSVQLILNKHHIIMENFGDGGLNPFHSGLFLRILYVLPFCMSKSHLYYINPIYYISLKAYIWGYIFWRKMDPQELLENMAAIFNYFFNYQISYFSYFMQIS